MENNLIQIVSPKNKGDLALTKWGETVIIAEVLPDSWYGVLFGSGSATRLHETELYQKETKTERSTAPVTKVIFRKWGRDIIALFPALTDDYIGMTCVSYMHNGQHVNADYDMIIRRSKPASPREYKDLFEELTRIGYTLQVAQRATYQDRKDRQDQAKQYREENRCTS